MSRALRVLDALALATVVLVIGCSLARPLFYWDSWAYHLPFSAHLLDIGGARHAFLLSEQMRLRYDGFPLAAELIQGVLWKVTGTISATALVNSAALAVFAVTVVRALGASPAVVVFGALAVPLVALHATATYIDLFVGACVALQAVAAVSIEAALRNAQARPLAQWCAAFVASAALAGNSKMTGMVMSVAIGGFLAGYLVLTRAAVDRRKLVAVLVVVAAAAAIAAGTALKNVQRYGNPMYPFDFTVAGMHLEGPEPEYHSYPVYTAPLGPLARPVNWVLSITDVDWLIRGDSPGYSIDMWAGEDTAEGTPARTGGYGGVLVVAALAALAMLLARADRAVRRERRFLLALFGFVTLVTAFMPQSHELRYSLHWPLMLVTAIAALAKPDAIGAKAAGAMACACFAAFAISQARLGYTLRLWPLHTQALALAREASVPSVADVRARGAVCLGPEFNPRQFAYSAVFHGGDYVVEQGSTRCARYPALR